MGGTAMSELSIEQLLNDLEDTIDQYHEAKAEHDKARSEYEGHSWDWAGSYLIAEMMESRKRWRLAFLKTVAACARDPEMLERAIKSEEKAP
jgi:hypothetical protein